MLNHDIIKHSTRDFECRVCGKTWHSRPQTACPGLRIYRQDDYKRPLTKTQLNYMGYRTTKAWLPPPVGCFYYMRHSSYILLYDPAQAVKKRPIKRLRRTLCISQISWPLACRPLLDTLDTFRHTDAGYGARLEEVAEMAFHLLAFSSAEIEQFAGNTIPLIISPILIHQTYSVFRQNRWTQSILGARIRDAYRDQKQLRPV